MSQQAIICIVGEKMRDQRGIAGKLFSALAFADINVVAISQGSKVEKHSLLSKNILNDVRIKDFLAPGE